jgi:hypothetical protein
VLPSTDGGKGIEIGEWVVARGNHEVEKSVKGLKDASGLYEVERRATHAVRPGFRVNGGDTSATFLILQGIGEYDFVPLTEA